LVLGKPTNRHLPETRKKGKEMLVGVDRACKKCVGPEMKKREKKAGWSGINQSSCYWREGKRSGANWVTRKWGVRSSWEYRVEKLAPYMKTKKREDWEIFRRQSLVRMHWAKIG